MFCKAFIGEMIRATESHELRRDNLARRQTSSSRVTIALTSITW